MVAVDLPKKGFDDQEIIARLKAGDLSACRACVEAHSDELYRLALRVLGDASEAEDVVQETFFNAFKSLNTFDGRSSLGTWLFRIAYNAALMRLRTRRRVVPMEDEDDGAASFPQVVAWSEEPDALLQRQETAEILDKAIAMLPHTLREVFILRDVEQVSVAETAQRLGLSESAVKVRLHRARMALREHLSDYFGERAPAQVRTITCEQLLKYLSEYIDHELNEPLARKASEHIATCPHCHVLVDTTQKTIKLYRTHARTRPERVIPADRRKRLYDEIQAAFLKRAPA